MEGIDRRKSETAMRDGIQYCTRLSFTWQRLLVPDPKLLPSLQFHIPLEGEENSIRQIFGRHIILGKR